MVCQACGSPVQGPFCSRCGAPSPAPAYPPPAASPYAVPEQRVARHVQTLAILWYVYGGYRAITGIIGALVLAGISTGGFMGAWGQPRGFPFMGAPWMAGLAGFIAVVTLIFAALSFLVGFALQRRKPWGRILAIVLGVLQLIKVPVGTALGIYTLWVLAPGQSGAEYDAMALHS